MATEEEYKRALIKAHKAGDTEAANLFAGKIKQMRSGQGDVVNNIEPQTKEEGVLDKAIGTAENVGSFLAGAATEPVAGIAGLADLGAEYLGFDGLEGSPGDVVNRVRGKSAEFFAPESDTGKRYQQNVAETLAPVGEAISGAENYLGESTLNATGSPFLASIAHSLPTATLELLGIKGSRAARGVKSASKSAVSKAIKEAAPSSGDLKNIATSIYREIDNTGAMIKPESMQSLANKIERQAIKQGMDPRTTKVASGVVESIKESASTAQPISELDTLRKIANASAKSIDPTEKMLGSLIKSNVEDFMDSLKASDMVKGSESLASVAKKYKSARKLYGQAKKSEMIQDAISQGADARSGVENGIRNEIGKITRSRKLRNFYTSDELSAMKDLVQGDFKTNFAKMLGRMGFMEGSSTSMLGSLGGVFAGSSLLGPAGAVAAPTIGVAARQIAKRLTTNKAKFLDEAIRSGTDAKRITKAYLDSVPKAKRSIEDLSSLLSDPAIDIAELESISNKFVKDAVDAAKGKRFIDLSVGAAAGASAESLRGQEDGN